MPLDWGVTIVFDEGNVREHVLSDDLWHFGSHSLTRTMLSTMKRVMKKNHLGFDDSSEFCNHRRCLLLPAFTKVPH